MKFIKITSIFESLAGFKFNYLIVICGVIIALLYYFFNVSKIVLIVSDGDKFIKHLPPVFGVYDIYSDGRYSRSRINGEPISCGGIMYAGSAHRDCGLRQLKGKDVVVWKVMLPTEYGEKPFVRKFVSDGVVYIDRSDEELKSIWIESSISSIGFKCVSIFIYFVFIISVCLFIFGEKFKYDDKNIVNVNS